MLPLALGGTVASAPASAALHERNCFDLRHKTPAYAAGAHLRQRKVHLGTLCHAEPTQSAALPHRYNMPVSDDQHGIDLSDEDILQVKTLRNKLHGRDSPFTETNNFGCGFVGDGDLCLLNTMVFEGPHSSGSSCQGGIYNSEDETCVPLPPYAIRSGPRRQIYFEPKEVTAAIVTCGGLCPGLNDVIQNIVYTLADYGVPSDQVLGIKYGLRGFYNRNTKPVHLTRETVDGIQLRGGTILGTSRGGASMEEIVKRLKLWGVNHLYVIGGNGGNAAANAIDQECHKQEHDCCVVGVPKSIDNDILLIDKCFGFETSVERAQMALMAAKVEARSTRRGIGLVKLMGRSSGFITMQASMASGVVDVCLIPEVAFKLEKLIDFVTKKVNTKGHCVVCVAEGAGQDLVSQEAEKMGKTDASGNPILKDIGLWLRGIFREQIDCDLKYIDPSYMIRASPTMTTDRIYCKVLGQGAVHGAFAGYTGFTIGLVNTHYVLLPIGVIIQAPRVVDPLGRSYNRLVTAINQPALI